MVSSHSALAMWVGGGNQVGLRMPASTMSCQATSAEHRESRRPACARRAAGARGGTMRPMRSATSTTSAKSPASPSHHRCHHAPVTAERPRSTRRSRRRAPPRPATDWAAAARLASAALMPAPPWRAPLPFARRCQISPRSSAKAGVLSVSVLRGRGMSTVKVARLRPGWAVIRITRSPSSTASSIEWVM